MYFSKDNKTIADKMIVFSQIDNSVLVKYFTKDHSFYLKAIFFFLMCGHSVNMFDKNFSLDDNT